MNLHAWSQQRARYSPARRGRHERGATVSECALIAASAQAMGLRRARPAQAPPSSEVPTPSQAA